MARLLIGERQIAFDLGDLLYLSNRIDGVYPNYHSRIPEEFTREVRFNRSHFLEKVRSAGAISEERNNSIIMRFQPGRVQFSARTYEVGSYEGSMEVAYEGESFDLAFNHVYLAEVMRVVDSEEMVMKVFRNTSPVVFIAPEHEQSLFVVMPITLSSIAETEEA